MHCPSYEWNTTALATKVAQSGMSVLIFLSVIFFGKKQIRSCSLHRYMLPISYFSIYILTTLRLTSAQICHRLGSRATMRQKGFLLVLLCLVHGSIQLDLVRNEVVRTSGSESVELVCEVNDAVDQCKFFTWDYYTFGSVHKRCLLLRIGSGFLRKWLSIKYLWSAWLFFGKKAFL